MNDEAISVIVSKPMISAKSQRIANRLQDSLGAAKIDLGATTEELLDAVRIHYAAMVAAQVPECGPTHAAKLFERLKQAEGR